MSRSALDRMEVKKAQEAQRRRQELMWQQQQGLLVDPAEEQEKKKLILAATTLAGFKKILLNRFGSMLLAWRKGTPGTPVSIFHLDFNATSMTTYRSQTEHVRFTGET